MKKMFILLTIGAFFLFLTANAQEQKKEDTPEGMETKQIGGTSAVIPKGMKVVETKGLVVLENISDYVSRQISEMQARITKLEENQDMLKKEVDTLKEQLKAKKVITE